MPPIILCKERDSIFWCDLDLIRKEWIFNYTGGIQQFNASPGFYLLEVWGGGSGLAAPACGGCALGIQSGPGGYSRGTLVLTTDRTLYIVCGGRSPDAYATMNPPGFYNNPGGYNGGGMGRNRYAGGGGATHIAFRSGTLQSLNSFRSDVIIVAGGGAGGCLAYTGGRMGCGGGLTGVAPGPSVDLIGQASATGFAGTQTAAGLNGRGYNGGATFGLGGSVVGNPVGNDVNNQIPINPNANPFNVYTAGGGGGGWFGGGAGIGNCGLGAGGSGYIAGVQDGLTIQGDQTILDRFGNPGTGNPGHGYTRITRIGSFDLTVLKVLNGEAHWQKPFQGPVQDNVIVRVGAAAYRQNIIF